MRKKLLLFATLFLSITASGQLKKHPPLQKENVDFKSITDTNYFFYKLATTVPLSPVKEIDSRYVLKNFSWKNTLKTNFDASFQLGSVLNDSLKMREPLPEEKTNFIYLAASIPNDQLPLVMATTHLGKIEPEGKSYVTKEIKNLYNLDFRLIANLVDNNSKLIRLGQICEVTTHYNLENDAIDFTIALELADAKFTDINNGNIEMMFGGFRGVEYTVIKKSDVGETIRFCSSMFDVIAFENGILHLRYDKKFEKHIDMFRNDFKFIGNIGENKFHIKCNYNPLLYVAYVKYRDKPKLSFDEFQKYTNPKNKVSVDMDDMRYGVMIYHFGYDMDSLNLYIPDKLLPTTLTGAISVRKNGDQYAFNNIYKKNNKMVDNLTMEHVEKVKAFFRANVSYPSYAQENSIQGIVRFRFTLSPDGVISNIEIESSPDRSLSDEVRRIATKVPKFKSNMTEDFRASMALEFKL